MTQRELSAGPRPWMVSLHGGHSGEFCDHAEGALREMLEAAARAGYHTFGVSEHAPRRAERFLYENEIALGWDVATQDRLFEAYVGAIQALVGEFADRLIVLRGFEVEVVPADAYIRLMRAYRALKTPAGVPAFDYCVGSVHYVDEWQIDGPPENYRAGVEAFGGFEALVARYYDLVAEMIAALRPEVVGHLDLMRRNHVLAGFGSEPLDSARIRAAADRALESARAAGAILDLNTAGWRKGLEFPYPAPWLVQRAAAMGIPFCFGDDSHRVSDVGAGVADARDYLLRNGVQTVTILTRDGDPATGPVARREVRL